MYVRFHFFMFFRRRRINPQDISVDFTRTFVYARVTCLDEKVCCTQNTEHRHIPRYEKIYRTGYELSKFMT